MPVDSSHSVLKRNPASLLFAFGESSHDRLEQSWISYKTEDEAVAKHWQSVGRRLKKKAETGAWLQNAVTGERDYFPSYKCTNGAKKLHLNGTQLTFGKVVVIPQNEKA